MPMHLCLMLGLATLAACGSGERKVAQPQEAADIKRPVASETRVDGAPTPPGAAAVPDITMPPFAPQYPGSKIRAVNSSPSGQNVHEVTLETRDDAASIMAFYRNKFLAAGLIKTSDFQSGGTGMLSAADKKRKAAIAITSTGANNSVIVTYSGD